MIFFHDGDMYKFLRKRRKHQFRLLTILMITSHFYSHGCGLSKINYQQLYGIKIK